MLFFGLILLASLVTGIRLPKLPDPDPPKPNNPFNNPYNNPVVDPFRDPINPPKPIPNFNDPVPPPKPVEPAQQVAIQTNMATLEKKAELGEIAVNFAGELVKAIQGSGTDEQTTITDPNLLLPNTTLDMKLYTPCMSYAQKLESCASSVPSFYTTTNSLAQASCACYAPMSSGSCAKSTFNTRFDDYATSCQQFMSSNGYANVASAMNNSLLIPSPHFCQSIGAVFRTNSTTGLRATLAPTACAPATAPENTGGAYDNMVEGRSARQLTSEALRDALVVSTSVSGFFWLFLL